MNFRTIAQMNDHIVGGLGKLSRDIDLVVGIPRSGMLPATILGLYLNVSISDVDGLLNNRFWEPGVSRRATQRLKNIRDARKILVIDDSCCSGRQIGLVRERIENACFSAEIIYAAVYVAPDSTELVDVYFDVCPMPRLFEWNLMHHSSVENACFDIDGVLCYDPTDEENDDGENYGRFLKEARPLWLPTVTIGWIVTSRLEKYRSQTEEWLFRHGIKYKELIMLNMKSGAERRAAGCHGRFKGEIFKSKHAQIFVESNPAQAAEIAEIGCKAVFCVEDRNLYFPSAGATLRYMSIKLPQRVPHVAWRLISAVRRRIRF